MHLVWLRSDLRLQDNQALYEACQGGGAVRVLFCATPQQWEMHGDAPAKLAFQQSAYNDLAARLASYGIAADLLEGTTYLDLPKRFARYAHEHGVTDLWFTEELPINEQKRDQAVTKALMDAGVHVHALPVEVPIPYERLAKKDGTPYHVFTPWYRLFCTHLQEAVADPLPPPKSVGPALPTPQHFSWTRATFRQDLWSASEKQAHKRLKAFVRDNLKTYTQKRDIPSDAHGTSGLSPYITNGLLSVRQCVCAVQEHTTSWAQHPWTRELAWREFYRYLLFFFPRLAYGHPFRAHGVPLTWPKKPEWIQAWQQGRTGFPIIDAGMRQLVETGWMHNRLRMLTASFLSKLLLQDWHVGENFFMNHLIDGDFASNNGGWQWCASTGCDASPWFRIFNPLIQSKRFDPDGSFIRLFVPALRDVDTHNIHDPPAHERAALGYPPPIIDYREARQASLAFYRQATSVNAAKLENA